MSFESGNLGNGYKPKIYVTSITQTDVFNPVSNEIVNTYGFTFIWTRIGQGLYRATFAEIDINKTSVFVNTVYSDSGYTLSTIPLLYSNKLDLSFYDSNGNQLDLENSIPLFVKIESY